MEFDNDRTVVRTGHRTSRAPGDDMNAMSGAMNTLPIGTRLGEFEIMDLIGEGGFGIVYLAYDHSLDRHVALKEYMPSGMAARTQMRQVTVRSRQYEDTFVTGLKSFINEARLLARFDSPSLVKVYRFWEENGTAYMAMPFYDGVTLKQAYKEKRISPDEEWIRALLANMFDALETIHREQCFHRDVAPDNILLLKDGRPLLLDFGAARRVIGDLTQGPTVILKPGFAPIEQYADIPGLRQGAWTDIYALGAVVYYLITGKAPSPAVSRVVHDDMVPARAAGRGRFSDAFLAAIDHALAVKPEHRIQSVPAMRLALDMEGVEARPLPGTAGAARAGKPKAGAAPESGAAGMTGMAGKHVNQAARQETRQAARSMPPSTMPKDAADADADADATEVDWKKSMVGEQRYYPQERSRRKAGVIAAVLLAAGAGSALIAYQLITPGQGQDVLAQAEDTRRGSAGAMPAASTGTPDTARGMDSGDGSGGTVQGTARVPAPRPAPTAATPPMAPVAPAPPAPPTASDATRTRDIIPPPIQAERSSAAKDKGATRELPPQAKATAPAAPATEAAEERLWNGAKNTDTAEGYKAYLKRYPEGKYAAVARILAQEKQHSELAMLGEPSERQAKGDAAVSRSSTGTSTSSMSGTSGTSGTSRSGNGRDTAKTADGAPRERSETAAATTLSQRSRQVEQPQPVQPPQKADTPASAPAATPADTIAKNTAPAAQSEQARREAPLPAEPKEENSLPAAAGPQRTYTFPGQTMVGNFSADPVSGLVSGSGQIRWDNGDRFEGRLVKGVKEGKGRFVWANGQEYSGDWSADKPNGRGVLKFANGNRYDGEVRDGQPHGQGTTRFQSGDVYSGNWVRGVLNGRGVLQFATGDRYEGELRNGEPDGQGKTRFRSGDVYVGQWARGKHHGQGRYTWQSGNYWEGEFRDGSQTSNGQLVRAESSPGTVPATASGGEGTREGHDAEGAGR
ncbi:serine/threonine-protein kinase [Noviherbaspirillum aerium]|uniref:serine/threonine-protein kinase n=1 Tax=Noviherbaspirillum aerium TaxID=2588497 RepID=UPI00124BE6A7|nr:serine/threonine-protein kinase [Noviherbaspirillum aerium]